MKSSLSPGIVTEQQKLICQSSQLLSWFEDNDREEQQDITASFVVALTAVPYIHPWGSLHGMSLPGSQSFSRSQNGPAPQPGDF